MDHKENMQDDKPRSPPTFSGNTRPMRISVEDEVQYGEERTRRVRGVNPLMPSSTGSIVATAPLHASISSSIGSSIMTTSNKRALLSTIKGWVLEEAPVLPDFHPLERTAVFCPHSTAQSIASRVSAILKERSIQAKFNSAEADCLTMENVEFTVCLYRGKKEFNHGTICEVLRLAGNSICFYDDTKAILEAAENKTSLQPPAKKLRSIPAVESDRDTKMSSTSLNFLRKMFVGGLDTQLLGLQILESMTDSSKIGIQTAWETSRLLMEPGNEIAELVFNLVKEPTLAVQGMIVLANVVSLEAFPIAFLKPLLIGHLQSTDAQLAYLASRCLKPQDVDSELADAISKARQLGAEGHDGLYKRAETLLESRD